MHKSHEMGRCTVCGGPRTLMISGVLGKFLLAQHRCSSCSSCKTFRKELENPDNQQMYGEQQREFERTYYNYQVWPPVLKPKEIAHAAKLEGTKNNDSDETPLRKKEGRRGILRKSSRREDKGSGKKVEEEIEDLKIHVLKTDLEPFQSLWEGNKTAEFRKNDRDFKIGELLELRCADGRGIVVRITHIQSGYGIPSDYVMLSFKRGTRLENLITC